MQADEVVSAADRCLMATYKRLPVVLARGRGTRVWDIQGRAYTDFVAGIAVCNLGHAHPRLVEILSRQAADLWHVSNLYYTVPQTRLARQLVRSSFADRVFFCNSGAEANEAAIKLVRRRFQAEGHVKRHRIVAMEQSFHGRTMGALAATGQRKIRKGFEPVLPGFDFVPFGDIEALRQRLDDSTAAVMLEPIQGEGGVVTPAREYLADVRELCDRSGAVLIFDEIQSGMGRTGRLFAYEHYGVAPDVMTLAKGLANGFPIGAMLAREEVASAFEAGTHASTFGGSPLAAAVAAEVLKIIENEGLIEACARKGLYFKDKLEMLCERHERVEQVRGMGLLLGLKLRQPGAPLVQACLRRGFLINCIQEQILRFAPPLIISEGEIDALIACLDEIFEAA